jgi:hypothetical protein
METGYPKVLDSRKASTMMSTWTEYLRLNMEHEGTAILEICKYEALAELEADDEGKVVVPEEIYGVKVIGVEGGLIIGGQLICDNDERRFAFTQATLSDAISWLEAERWKASEQMLEELTKSVGADHQEKQASRNQPQEQPYVSKGLRRVSPEEARALGMPERNELVIHPVPRRQPPSERYVIALTSC